MKREQTDILTIFVVCYKEATVLVYIAFPLKYVERTVIELTILPFFLSWIPSAHSMQVQSVIAAPDYTQ